MKSYVESKITILLDVLSNESIVESNRLTLKGNICSFFNEINPIIMGSIVNESLTTDIIRNISIDEFLGFLTCFYPIKVNENNKTYSIINCRNNSRNLQYLVDRAIEIQQIYVKYETNNRFVTGEFSDEITFDLNAKPGLALGKRCSPTFTNFFGRVSHFGSINFQRFQRFQLLCL